MKTTFPPLRPFSHASFQRRPRCQGKSGGRRKAFSPAPTVYACEWSNTALGSSPAALTSLTFRQPTAVRRPPRRGRGWAFGEI